MSTIGCPKCGASNQSTSRFCQTCGTPLAAPPAVAQPSPIPPPSQPWYSSPPPVQPYYPYTPPNYWETQRIGKIDNTKTGLLLLMIGSLISWVPFVGAVGGLLVLIGAIFIIIGRQAFGHDHDRNVIASIIIFVVGVGVYAVVFVAIFFAALSNTLANPGSVPVQPAGWTFLLIIPSAIIGIAEVLFTYALQNGTGRALLWTAYVIGIATGIVNALLLPLLLPLATRNITFLFSSGIFLLTSLLAAPAAILYGIAFYVARQRLERHEIPSPLNQ